MDTAAAVAVLDMPGNIEELELRLQEILCGRVRDFRLSLNDHGIVLRGFARTYHAKQVAQEAAMSESKLPILANEIEVN